MKHRFVEIGSLEGQRRLMAVVEGKGIAGAFEARGSLSEASAHRPEVEAGGKVCPQWSVAGSGSEQEAPARGEPPSLKASASVGVRESAMALAQGGAS